MKSIFEKVIEDSQKYSIILSAQPLQKGKILKGIRAQAEAVYQLFQMPMYSIPFTEMPVHIDSVQTALVLLHQNKMLWQLNKKASYFIYQKETDTCLGMLNVYCHQRETAEIYSVLPSAYRNSIYFRQAVQLIENAFLGRLGFKQIVSNVLKDDLTVASHRLFYKALGYERGIYVNSRDLEFRTFNLNMFETFRKTRESFKESQRRQKILSTPPQIDIQKSMFPIHER